MEAEDVMREFEEADEMERLKYRESLALKIQVQEEEEEVEYLMLSAPDWRYLYWWHLCRRLL